MTIPTNSLDGVPAPRWNDDRLDDLRTLVLQVRDECRTDHSKVMSKLEEQDDRRDDARQEMRKTVVTGVFALIATLLTVAGTIVVAVVL